MFPLGKFPLANLSCRDRQVAIESGESVCHQTVAREGLLYRAWK